MTTLNQLALSLDPALLFAAVGYTPDPWQTQLLRSGSPRILINCSRQAGKSTTVAALSLHQVLFHPRSLILLLSKSQRQSIALFRKVYDFINALGRPVKAEGKSVLRLELANDSRIVSLPGNEANIRSYSGVNLLVIDEAARGPDRDRGAPLRQLCGQQGRRQPARRDCGRHRAFADAPAQGAALCLPEPHRRGAALPLSPGRRARHRRQEPDRRPQPRPGRLLFTRAALDR